MHDCIISQVLDAMAQCDVMYFLGRVPVPIIMKIVREENWVLVVLFIDHARVLS